MGSIASGIISTVQGRVVIVGAYEMSSAAELGDQSLEMDAGMSECPFETVIQVAAVDEYSDPLVMRAAPPEKRRPGVGNATPGS